MNTATDFRYPANIRGYIPGKSLGRNIGHGLVKFVPNSDGEGYVTRDGEAIGRLARDPQRGWKLLDIAGNIVGVGMQQYVVAGGAQWSLPSAADQAAFLASRVAPLHPMLLAAE